MSENLTENRRATGQYIMLGDTKIRYFEEGEGETLLMIHGLGQAMYTFRKNVRALSEYCHVVTVDLIGHGLSDKPECDYTITDFSDMVYEFIQAMGFKKVSLMGFSTGAIIAADVAIKHPEVVSRLIMLTPGGVMKSYPSIIKQLTIPVLSDFIFTFFNTSKVKRVLNAGYFDPTFVTKDMVKHYYRVLSNKENLDAAIVALSSWDDSEIAYSLSEIKAPTYIFWGENDTWHDLELLELYEEAIPSVYSATFADCGHFPHEEKADELNKKMIEIMTKEI